MLNRGRVLLELRRPRTGKDESKSISRGKKSNTNILYLSLARFDRCGSHSRLKTAAQEQNYSAAVHDETFTLYCLECFGI